MKNQIAQVCKCKSLVQTAKELNAMPGVRVNVTSRQEILQKLKQGERVSPTTRRLLMLS
ncbi:hypothetical protein [uncultured Microbulbifer sp.]|uniref:hypothetical protein n=1 Tax=uncultured Microbulbifer sp. TaxID=348147 RepID=UPI002625E6B8|nr:hypothetical protein [uncultured Microbulbifer sp.]